MKHTLAALIACAALALASMSAVADDEKEGATATAADSQDTMAPAATEPAAESKDAAAPAAEGDAKQ
jgi:hypothetical protein